TPFRQAGPGPDEEGRARVRAGRDAESSERTARSEGSGERSREADRDPEGREREREARGVGRRPPANPRIPQSDQTALVNQAHDEGTRLTSMSRSRTFSSWSPRVAGPSDMMKAYRLSEIASRSRRTNLRTASNELSDTTYSIPSQRPAPRG